jgi:hypothetical protein
MKVLVLILSLFFAFSVFGQQKMSDREADGLKGKVKSITTSRNLIESKNYADNTLKKYRDKVETYDPSGTLTERIDYEYNMKDVFTVIDGDLTEKSSQIVKSPQNKAVFTVADEEEEKPLYPKDERYDLKYKFKFDDKGRRIETVMYGNTRNVWKKVVYKYDEKGFLSEALHYNNGKTLNEQYTYKYDTDGNLTEAKLELHRAEKNIISFLKYSDYKLDSEGNWIARTATSLGEFQGKELKTVTKQSRKIVYYK